MSATAVRIFQAADAFAYVDAYRRHSLDQPPAITSARDRAEEAMSRMEVVPSRVWAELRGIEHALRYKLKREDPGMVVLGPADGILDKEGHLLPAGTVTPEVQALREEKGELEEEITKLKKDLSHLIEHQHELDVQLIKARQQVGNLQRKLEHSYAYFVVVGATALVGLVTLISILIFR